jgi:serine/threonine protein kinase
MQYLEGETLADRIARGALPLADALTIAVQIASAIDRAHRAGIVHRDLKPGNVMLTKSGAKLMDFGLAKQGTGAAGGAGRLVGGVRLPVAWPRDRQPDQRPNVAQGYPGSPKRPWREGGSPGDLTASPTVTSPLTAQGTILGTFQYMAPEQIEGIDADARTDIFAFGAVLYEMVTGRKAFTGKSQASLIGAIMSTDPPLVSTLQPVAPAALDRVVKKCLAKGPDARWQSAHDLGDELQWITQGSAETGSVSARTRLRVRVRRVEDRDGCCVASSRSHLGGSRPTCFQGQRQPLAPRDFR